MLIAAAWAYRHPRPAKDQIAEVGQGTDSDRLRSGLLPVLASTLSIAA